MKIIIDGCDGTGKSTLAKEIAKTFGMKIEKFSAPKTKNPFKEFIPFYKDQKYDNIIFDRCWISEGIYGPLKGREGLSRSQKRKFIDLTKNDLYIIAHTSIEFVERTFNTRGETYINLEEAKEINEKFYQEAFKLKDTYGLNIIFYDVEMYSGCAEKFINDFVIHNTNFVGKKI